MKLVFIIKGMKAAGGAERVLAQVSGAMANRGHATQVLTFSGELEDFFYTLHPEVRATTLNAGDVDQPTGARMLLSSVGALRQWLKRERPDLAIGFMHSAYVPLAFAALGLGIPVVGSEHIVRTYYRNRPVQFAALCAAAPFIKALTVLSAPIAAEFPFVVRRIMHPLANPLEPPPPAAGRALKQKIILTIGRLDTQKDQQTLIDAFARIADLIPDWRLRIVGEGPLRNALEARIQHHGLGERIALPGAQRDIGKEYQAATLFVLPSLFESFGLVVAEAMLAELPVVAFADCPGIDVFFSDPGCGKLVPGADRTGALANAMLTLIQDPVQQQAMGKAAKKAVQNRFPPADIYDQWEALLKHALA